MLVKKNLNSTEGKNTRFYHTRIMNQQYILLKCSEYAERPLPEMLKVKLVHLGVHHREQLMLADEGSPQLSHLAYSSLSIDSENYTLIFRCSLQ